MSPQTTAARPEGATAVKVVDCDAHNNPIPPDLTPYLSARWRGYMELIGLRTPSEVGLVRAKPLAARTDTWAPDGRLPANNPVFFREDLLDRYEIDIAVLNPLTMAMQTMVGGNQPLELTAELMRASNEWTREHFIEPDERLYSSICVPFENGRDAVAEIERWGADPRWVQVLVPFRSQRPIGNPKYWDMFEAAVAHDLPIAFHPGSIGNNQITGAGWPSYYYEDHVGYPGSLMAQMASLIAEGVFERFPDLKIVFQEGGWSWISPYSWRMDRLYGQLAAEVSHLQRKPSEYVAEHFWYTTQPIEEPERPEQFMEALEIFGLGERLLFSSDYPHWDFDAPDQALPRSIGEDLTAKIMSGNAIDLYGFQGVAS